MTRKPLEIFFSYSHKDVKLRDELEKHLTSYKHLGVVAAFHDREIRAGKNWKREIDEHLNHAGLILLLISPDFLASDYCYDVEMQRALEREQAGEAKVVPILLRPVDWTRAPFAHLQALPSDAKFVTTWRNRDLAFKNIAEGIGHIIVQEHEQPTKNKIRVLQMMLDNAQQTFELSRRTLDFHILLLVSEHRKQLTFTQGPIEVIVIRLLALREPEAAKLQPLLQFLGEEAIDSLDQVTAKFSYEKAGRETVAGREERNYYYLCRDVLHQPPILRRESTFSPLAIPDEQSPDEPPDAWFELRQGRKDLYRKWLGNGEIRLLLYLEKEHILQRRGFSPQVAMERLDQLRNTLETHLENPNFVAASRAYCDPGPTRAALGDRTMIVTKPGTPYSEASRVVSESEAIARFTQSFDRELSALSVDSDGSHMDGPNGESFNHIGLKRDLLRRIEQVRLEL